MRARRLTACQLSHLSAAVLLGLAILGSARSAAAETQLPPGDCSADNVSNEQRAAGCAAVIANGRLAGATLEIAHCNLGYALTEMRQYDRVIEASDVALKVNAGSACAYLNRGRAWYHKGDLDRALADYNETIRLDPAFHEAYANRGTLYFDREEFARAIAEYDKAIAINGTDPMYFSDRGNTRFRMGEYDRAIADQTRALGLDQDYVAAYMRRGWALMEKADYAGAEADFAKALTLVPGSVPIEASLKRAQEYRAHPEYAADDREEAKGLNFGHFRRMIEQSRAPRR